MPDLFHASLVTDRDRKRRAWEKARRWRKGGVLEAYREYRNATTRLLAYEVGIGGIETVQRDAAA